MKTATLTAEQKDKLTAAIKKSLDDSSSVKAALYPRPKVEPADAFGVLDPNKNNAVDNTYIVVGGIPLNYLVSFYWNGDYSIKAVTSEGTDIQVKVPSALVIAAGDTATQPILVIYSVLNPNEPEGIASEPLKLTVRKYVRPEYPNPVITEAQGSELNVTALTANAHMTLAAWPGQAVGQKLWLSVVSIPQITLQNWNPLNVTELGAQSRGISKDLLKKLSDGSAFTLKLEASFDGGDTRFAFSEQTYQIKKALAYALNALEVDGAVGDVIDLGIVIGDPVIVQAPAYVGQAAGHRILLSWAGIEASGTPVNYSHEYTVQAGEETGKIYFEVPRLNLDPLGGGTLQLSYQVVIGSTGSVQNSPVTTYDVKNQDEVDAFEDFETHPSGSKPSPFDTLYMRFWGGKQVLSLIQDSRKMRHTTELYGNSNTLSIKLKSYYSKVTFDLLWNGSIAATLRCYYGRQQPGADELDLSGLLVEQVTIPRSGYWQAYEFNHKDIVILTVTGTNTKGKTFEIDNFHLTNKKSNAS